MADIKGWSIDQSFCQDSYISESSMELCLPTCTNKTVTSKHQVIVCGLCTRWFHFACIGLPQGRPGGAFTGTYLCLGCLAMLRDMHNHFKRARCKEKRMDRLEATVTRLKSDHVVLKGRVDRIDPETAAALPVVRPDIVDQDNDTQHRNKIPMPAPSASPTVIQRVGRSAAPTNGGHHPSHWPSPANPGHRPPPPTATLTAHEATVSAAASHPSRGSPRPRDRRHASAASGTTGLTPGTIYGQHRSPAAVVTQPTNFLQEYLSGTREKPSPYPNLEPPKKGSSENTRRSLENYQSAVAAAAVTEPEMAHSDHVLKGHSPLVPKPDPDSDSEPQPPADFSELMEVQVKVEPDLDEVVEVPDLLPERATPEPINDPAVATDPVRRTPVIVTKTEELLRGAHTIWSDPASCMSDDGSYGSSGSGSVAALPQQPPGTSEESILKDLLLARESRPQLPPESESLEEDDYLFCYDCRNKVLGQCTVHPLIVLPDSEVAEDEHFQADLSIPKGLSIRSPAGQGGGHGVFADVSVPEGIVFGPYKGEIRPSTQGPRKREYCWKIVKTHSPSYTVDASNVEKSNWMRYVDTPDHTKFQNLVAFQYRGEIFYRTSKPIAAGTELVVWYGEHPAKKRRRTEDTWSGDT